MSNEQLRKDVRSLLISAKHGLTPDELRRDYLNLLGCPMPLRLLGFRNVLDMVEQMPDVVRVEFRRDGSVVLKAVGNETTNGIEELVSRQRESKTKKWKGRPGCFQIRNLFKNPVVLPRRGQARPVLSAQLRSQIRQLLSHGPLGLSELEDKYKMQFGKALQVTQNGFYSVSEMVEAASDFITIKQSRSGSQLLLRTVPHTANLSTHVASPVSGLTFPPSLPEHLPISSVLPAAEPVRREHSFEGKVLKLEEDLRVQIIEKSIGGTVSHELKDKLQKVVAEHGGTISIHNLPTEYKRMYGEDVPVAQQGFPSVTEMMAALTDTFSLQTSSDDCASLVIVMDLKESDTPPTGQCDLGASPSLAPNSSLTAESAIASSKSFYLSNAESEWEREEPGKSTGSKEDHRVADKTIDQMVHHLQDLRVSRASSVPFDAVRCQKLKPPTRLSPRELVPALVEQIHSPHHFHVRFTHNQEARALENMMFEMRSCYSCPGVCERYRLPDAYVRSGQVCCVSPRDMWHYRVVIHQVISASELEVYYVDFGIIATVDRARLRFLKWCYAVLPAQAVPSVLAAVRPTTGIWTQSAISFFQQTCGIQTLVAAIDSYQEDFLFLYLCDTNTQEDVYIHQALFEAGHALSAPPSFRVNAPQFNPVTHYFGGDPLAEVEPVHTAPSHTDHQSSKTYLPGIEESPDEDHLLDLPDLEYIGVPETSLLEIEAPPDVDLLSDLPKLEYISFSEGQTAYSIHEVQDKGLCSEKWDQEWTVRTKPVETTLDHDHSDEDAVTVNCESALQEAVREPKNGPDAPAESVPSLSGIPVEPTISNFLLRLFKSRACPNSSFQCHKSPLALRPAARLSAGPGVLP